MQLHKSKSLFETVQRSGIFADDKTFADAIPRFPVREIAIAFSELSSANANPLTAEQLREFVAKHFDIPADEPEPQPANGGREDIVKHIKSLWKTFSREPSLIRDGSTLLPLPEPYMVPGGRFREIYYWDSYFTMLGLRASGEEPMIQHMLANFQYLQMRHNLIPNGNRSYYLSRSQPPLLAMMAELVSAHGIFPALPRFRNALIAEHNYWMDRAAPTRHVVKLPDGSTLNRYWDQLDEPRPEAFSKDEQLAKKTTRPLGKFYRDLRSAAESGWDFSSRWLADPQRLETIRTTDIVPVDLNCFLWKLERTLAEAHTAIGDTQAAQHYEAISAARRRSIEKYCWSNTQGFFCDYDLDTCEPSQRITLAGATPLYFELGAEHQQRATIRTLEKHFLAPGGFVTTLCRTGQQWDSPNGWAPLQWLTIRGLEKTDATNLAAEAARRWIKLNLDVYERTGRMQEKYNVLDPANAPEEGDEYRTQQGFGWTNGVLLDLLRDYPL